MSLAYSDKKFEKNNQRKALAITLAINTLLFLLIWQVKIWNDSPNPPAIPAEDAGMGEISFEQEAPEPAPAPQQENITQTTTDAVQTTSTPALSSNVESPVTVKAQPPVPVEPKEVEEPVDLTLTLGKRSPKAGTAGGSGAGKSLFLANLGINWALQGLNVVYLTLELSEELVAMRMDAMVTGMATKDVFKNLDDVEMKVKMLGKKSGTYQVKYMPSGKTVNDIRAYMKEYEIKCGKKVDVLLVDYMDLLMPIGKKISAENLFVKDKYVSEELRNLAMEKQCVFVTAAQLNRGAVEEVEFDHSHISGGLSKIQTADNVIGIFTSRAMCERGRYQLQLMKTRSSSGVGMKIDLEFNIETLKISDLPEDEQESNGATQRGTSSIIDSIKRKTEVQREEPTEGESVGKVRANVESSKLRAILNNMGNDEDE